MTSPSISSRNKGFTLIEILVVIAILAMLIGLGLFMSMDSYRAYLSRSERDTVVSLLERARSRAMANSFETAWGVCYIAPNYIIFRGATCTDGAATNEATPGNPAASIVGLSAASAVVFSQLAGTTTGAVVTITEQSKVSTVTINHEGTIIW
jgi:prepilin-type N-terminal cleavage/methylation domain-containing protein